MNTISSTSLALLFLKYPKLIEGFSKVDFSDYEERIFYVLYESNHFSFPKLHTALNMLIWNLIPYIGEPELEHSVLENAIIKAIDWEGKSLEDVPDFEDRISTVKMDKSY
jgi:hypothetical protein